MKHLPFLLFLTLLACSQPQKPQPAAGDGPLTEAEQTVRLAQLQLDFSQPVPIDTSGYVLYLLLLEKPEQRGGGSFSSYSGPSIAYWNLVFYKPATGEYHLLDEQRKMLIHSYSISKASVEAAADLDEQGTGAYKRVDNLIYYSITTADTDQDGKLTTEDPSYLFISDLSGSNLRQISPDSLHVTHWQVLRASNKILILASKDTNGDKKFDDKDEVLPLVYDLRTGGYAQEVFGNDFKIKLKKQLDAQWNKQ